METQQNQWYEISYINGGASHQFDILTINICLIRMGLTYADMNQMRLTSKSVFLSFFEF